MPGKSDTKPEPAPDSPAANSLPSSPANATDLEPPRTVSTPPHQPVPPPARENDEYWLRQALLLAENAVGLASPNPTVGCVIVRNNTLVGSGAHLYDHLDHAEVVALRQAGALARSATAYVTLEPCSHTGRTGPCAQALIQAGVARVVIATTDPNPLVSGRGITLLRQAAIKVDLLEGSLTPQARRLNDGFARFIRHQLPFVTLKAGLSLDGRIAPAPPDAAPPAPAFNPLTNSLADAPPNPLPDAFHKSPGSSTPGSLTSSLPETLLSSLSGSSPGSFPSSLESPPSTIYLTSPDSLAAVQHMRHASDAILTGIGTALHDNPLLTDRSSLPRRRPLLRVVLDSELRLPLTSRLVQSVEEDLLIYTADPSTEKADRLRQAGVQIEQAPLLPPSALQPSAPSTAIPSTAAHKQLDLRALLASLAQRQILNLLVEGGSHLNRALLDQKLADKLCLFYAPIFLGEAGVPLLAGRQSLHLELQAPTLSPSGHDFRLEAYLRDPWR